MGCGWKQFRARIIIKFSLGYITVSYIYFYSSSLYTYSNFIWGNYLVKLLIVYNSISSFASYLPIPCKGWMNKNVCCLTGDCLFFLSPLSVCTCVQVWLCVCMPLICSWTRVCTSVGGCREQKCVYACERVSLWVKEYAYGCVCVCKCVSVSVWVLFRANQGCPCRCTMLSCGTRGFHGEQRAATQKTRATIDGVWRPLRSRG